MAIWEDLAHPKTVGPIMNNSTPYGFIWFDPHDGPLVVEVPPRVLGYLNDSWGR